MNFCKMSHFCRKVTAFVLLLLLFLSLLSPAVVHAEDHDSGGHQIGSGEDTDSPIDPILEDGDRTITLRFSYKQFYGSRENIDYNWTYKLTGKGKFVVRSYRFRHDSSKENGFFSMCFRVFSDKPFTAELSTSGGRAGTFSSAQVFNHKGIYFISNGVMGGLSPEYQGEVLSEVWTGFANLKVVSSEEDIPSGEDIIDSGMLDLTGDSYLTDDDNEKAAVYNKDLDLISFGVHDYPKWSIKRNADNSGWDFITDEESGARYSWTYKTDIEGAYIKFTYYGNYYAKMFSPTFKDGVLSISGDGVPNVVSMRFDRSLKEKMIYTKADLYNALYTKYGYSNIYAFETTYVYAQCFGYVDGRFCRGRTYRINYNMVKEAGDTWILEPTDTDPLPEEYIPDDSDPSPRPSDPDPDPGDFEDTTPNPYPPNPTDPDFPTDNSILNALKWLYETLDGLKDSLGAFPVLVNSVFGFLPQPVILLLGASIVLVVIMRFAGR